MRQNTLPALICPEQEQKMEPGKLGAGRQQRLQGLWLPCWLPFLLDKGEANHTSFTAAKLIVLVSLPTGFDALPVTAGRRSVSFRESREGAAVPICTTHLCQVWGPTGSLCHAERVCCARGKLAAGNSLGTILNADECKSLTYKQSAKMG